MALRIDHDHRRFRRSSAGKIKQNLRKYITHGEMIGRKGKDLVSIPLPQIDMPRFRFGSKQQGGVGQGDGAGGRRHRPAASRARTGRARPGQDPGEHVLEVELSLDELAADPGRGAGAARASSPRARSGSSPQKDRYIGIRRTGPESLRHFKRTFREALRRADHDRAPTTPSDPLDRPDPRGQALPLLEDRRRCPQSNAVIIYMMDVSGSMSDEQKEIVRIESFWIDTWLRSQYKGLETRYIIHDAVAQEVDRDTFYHTRETGGTMISSAYKLCAKMIESEFPPVEWNIYPFQFSDGDNWRRRHRAVHRAAEERPPAQGEPVLLRPGREPLRHRPVHQGPATTTSTSDDSWSSPRSRTRRRSSSRSRRSSGKGK